MTSLAVFLLVSILFKAEATYDCRRPEQVCVSGNCGFNSDVCTGCAAGFSGYNCGLEDSKVGVVSCATSNPCQAGSTCYDNAGTAACYCAPEDYGTNCKEKRFDIACTASKMIIGVNPLTAGDFKVKGIAYIETQRTDTACVATDVPAADPADDIPDTWPGQFLELAHADCGGVVAATDPITNRITYERNVVILYNKQLVTERDDLFTAKCVIDANGVVVDSSMVKVDPNDLGALKKTENEGKFSPVTLTLTSGGTPVDPAVAIKVGTELVFTFSIPTEYESMKITTGEANNTKPVGDPDEEKLPLIDDSCTTNKALQFASSPPTRAVGNKREITFKLKAFYFYGNDQVIFRFTVLVCLLSNDGDCDPKPTCPNKVGGPGHGRKKREAKGEEVLERVVTIVDPERSRQIGTTEKQESECRTSGEMTAALISMGIVIFTLLVLLTILIGKTLTGRHSRANSKQDLFSAQSVQSLPRI